jgi:hypothetical protein
VRVSDHGGHSLGPTRRGRPTELWTLPSLTDLAGPEASQRHAEAIAFAERAIELAATLGLPLPARVLGLRGGARFALGDAGGLDDTRRALEAAGQGLGLGRETAVLYNNLAEDLGRAEGPRARLELARQGAAFTQRRGIAEWVQPLGGLTARAVADLGRIDEARALTTKLLSDADTAEDRLYQLYLRAADARLSVRRGELSLAGPVEWVEQAVEKAREFGEPQWLTTLLVLAAVARAVPGMRAAPSRCSPNSNKYATSGTPRSTCQAFPTSCASPSRRASRASPHGLPPG